MKERNNPYLKLPGKHEKRCTCIQSLRKSCSKNFHADDALEEDSD